MEVLDDEFTAAEAAEVDAALARSEAFHRELVWTLIDAHNRMLLLALFGPNNLPAGAWTGQRGNRERLRAHEIRREAVKRVENRFRDRYPGVPEPLLELTLLRVIRDASLQSVITLAGRKSPPRQGSKAWLDTKLLFCGRAWPSRLESLRSGRFQTVRDIVARVRTLDDR